MKIQLDYNFALKDFETTKSKHLGQIDRLKKAIKKENAGSTYGFDLDWGLFQEQVEYYAKNSGFYMYNLGRKEGWVNELSPKRRLRMVKSFINGQTREQIGRELESRSWPASWDTALYCLFYKRINRIMKDLAKNYGF